MTDTETPTEGDEPEESTDVDTSTSGQVAHKSPTGGTDEEPEGDTFPREYVEKLREENARYRTRAGKADEATARLLAATVKEATAGILTDPTDLPDGDYLDGDGWPDPDAITIAARDLVEAKPHLADRRPRGNIGQGASPDPGQASLADMLRSRA